MISRKENVLVRALLFIRKVKNFITNRKRSTKEIKILSNVEVNNR